MQCAPVVIRLSDIDMSEQVNPRCALDEATVASYADALAAGATFPHITVFRDGKSLWIADGFHRVAAYLRSGMQAIVADVRDGSRRDALLYAVGANATHGLRRTNADKRRAVEMLLQDEEWVCKSDGWIAEKCAVSQPFVGKVRAEVAPQTQVKTVMTSAPERTGRDGKQYPAQPQRAPSSVPPPAPPQTDPDLADDSVIDATAERTAEGDTKRARHALAFLAALDDTERTFIRDDVLRMFGARRTA